MSTSCLSVWSPSIAVSKKGSLGLPVAFRKRTRRIVHPPGLILVRDNDPLHTDVGFHIRPALSISDPLLVLHSSQNWARVCKARSLSPEKHPFVTIHLVGLAFSSVNTVSHHQGFQHRLTISLRVAGGLKVHTRVTVVTLLHGDNARPIGMFDGHATKGTSRAGAGPLLSLSQEKNT